MLIRRHLHVRGLVQGVYYRDTCRQPAGESGESGMTGWSRNLHNGEVEAVFEGSPATVTRLVRRAAGGPGATEVTRCTVTAERPEGHRGFRPLSDARPT
ncbi:acylphosphatase [Streptomyces sp. NPDC018019]|uniref:acylphosphatase n=1 Tax=Streptomyces sp. NPDC018019 TaxID=3365030 RepID=UPI0037921CFF